MATTVRLTHDTLKKTIVAFGTIFNDIGVYRTNAKGCIEQTIKVPIQYSNRQKFWELILKLPKPEERKTEVVLPRMAFEFKGISYNPERKMQLAHNQIKCVDTTGRHHSIAAMAPYDMHLSLYVATKNQEDGIQIIEQILPLFNPELSVRVKDVEELNVERNIIFALQDVELSDEFEGSMDTRRTIIWTINFIAKVNLYSPLQNIEVIKKTIASVYAGMSKSNEGERYISIVDPFTANENDPHKIIDTIEPLNGAKL